MNCKALKDACAGYLNSLEIAQEGADIEQIKKLTDNFFNEIKDVLNLIELHNLLPEEPIQLCDYFHDECELDLGSIVYDGDRDYYLELTQNEVISHAMNEASKALQNNDFKTSLLKNTFRLSRSMAPKVYRALDRCVSKLALKTRFSIYVSQDPRLNAYCYPPQDGQGHILLTSSLVEKLSEDELTFVIGHELGHYLYKHYKISPSHFMQNHGQEISPALGIKLFSWQRGAELTADRIGLICCENYESACLANFKISSGVTSDALSFDLPAYISQFSEIESAISGGKASLEDLYSSHPINPIRVIALEIFSKSSTYINIVKSEKQPEYSEELMEKEVSDLMSHMEPSYLNSSEDMNVKMKEAVFFGGIALAKADGQIDQNEMQYLLQLLSAEETHFVEEILNDHNSEIVLRSMSERLKESLPHLSITQRCNVIRDIAIVATCDGQISENEMMCLAEICNIFQIHPDFAMQIIQSLTCRAA